MKGTNQRAGRRTHGGISATTATLPKRIRAEHRIALVRPWPERVRATSRGDSAAAETPRSGRPGQPVPSGWSVPSDEVLWAAFDDFYKGREIATLPCSRHGHTLSGFTAMLRERWAEEWEQVTGEKRPEAGCLYKMPAEISNAAPG